MADSQKKRKSRPQRAVRPRARKPASTAERVGDLAWAGQHGQAIELATAALATPGLSVGSRLDLLDLRAESRIAIGKLDLAAADAAAMARLAAAGKPHAFMAQALNRKALVQMRQGEMKPALETAVAATKAARRSRQKPLLAASLLTLGEVQARSGSYEAGRKTAQQAAQEMVELIDLFNVDRQAAEKPPINIGIGIASGEMVAGYAGTNKRATYTCIGDTVNLAARLETHTKVTQRAILIDQATRSALSARITVEPLGPVPFKGKATAVDVFSVNLGQKL